MTYKCIPCYFILNSKHRYNKNIIYKHMLFIGLTLMEKRYLKIIIKGRNYSKTKAAGCCIKGRPSLLHWTDEEGRLLNGWILGCLTPLQNSSYSWAQGSIIPGSQHRRAAIDDKEKSQTRILAFKDQRYTFHCCHVWLSFSDVCRFVCMCVVTACPEERAPCGSI